MDALKFIGKFIIAPLAFGVIAALGGRIVINAIDSKPLLAEPNQGVELKLVFGDNKEEEVKALPEGKG